MSFNFPGAAKLVRVPCVQNKAEGANLRLDLQPEDEGEGLEVGLGRSGPFATNLENCPASSFSVVASVVNLIKT